MIRKMMSCLLMVLVCIACSGYEVGLSSRELPNDAVNLYYDVKNPSNTINDPDKKAKWFETTLELVNLLYKTSYKEIGYFGKRSNVININGEFLENYSIYKNPKAFHKGIDLQGNSNMWVYSPVDGVIISSHVNRKTDNSGTVCIYVEEYDVTVIFDHFSNVEEGIYEGGPIKAGTRIARVGKKGTDAEHLHVGLYKGKIKTDKSPTAPNDGFIDPRFILTIHNNINQSDDQTPDALIADLETRLAIANITIMGLEAKLAAAYAAIADLEVQLAIMPGVKDVTDMSYEELQEYRNSSFDAFEAAVREMKNR